MNLKKTLVFGLLIAAITPCYGELNLETEKEEIQLKEFLLQGLKEPKESLPFKVLKDFYLPKTFFSKLFYSRPTPYRADKAFGCVLYNWIYETRIAYLQNKRMEVIEKHSEAILIRVIESLLEEQGAPKPSEWTRYPYYYKDPFIQRHRRLNKDLGENTFYSNFLPIPKTTK